MSDWIYRRGGRDRLINWLGLDAWIDSKLFETTQNLKDRYTRASNFFDRFRLSGFKRGMTEILSEGLTVGTGGMLVMLALAVPAFQDIDEGKWLATGKYSVTFLDRNGNEIGKRGMNLDDSVKLEEVPDYLIKATLATEDRRFFEHFGVDLIGLARAMSENLRANSVVQGGSTLSQQLAKNLFLSSERSVQRKIKEAFLALWLETHLSKRDILKLYLDRAYMGGGAFGVEAAAQFYFGKSVREINLAEAAMMAGLFKAPTAFAPHVNLAASRARANDVLTNLVEAGFMTEGQVHAARLNPARPVETRSHDSPDWFLDWAFEEVQRLMEGKNEYNLVAQTTVDVDLQRKAEAAVTSTLKGDAKGMNARQAALVSMELDGAVRAIVGGRDYGESQFNRATHAKRQPGSSFKVYVYIAAVEQKGYTPKTTVRDSSRSCGNWAPKNYSGGYGGGGSMPLGTALAKSLNTVAAELSFVVGRDEVIEMTDRLGVKGIKKTCSMALGDYGITPLEHTGGYAHLANGGMKLRPYGITELRNSKGQVVYSRETDEPPPEQVLSTRVVEQMNQMMHQVITEGTGKRADLDFTIVAGKTGTSSSYRDAWFVGYTGKYVTGVWFGNDNFTPMSNVTGGALPAQTWKAYMSVAHTSMDIAQIPGLTLHGRQVEERARLAEIKRTQPVPEVVATGPKRTQSVLPDQTREMMKKLTAVFRKAGGLAEGAAGEATATAAPTVIQAPAALGKAPAKAPAAGSGALAPVPKRAPEPAAAGAQGPPPAKAGRKGPEPPPPAKANDPPAKGKQRVDGQPAERRAQAGEGASPAVARP